MKVAPGPEKSPGRRWKKSGGFWAWIFQPAADSKENRMEQENRDWPLRAEEVEDRQPAAGDGYQVKLEFFEGPLDLLLFLIRKKKIDINDIPMAVITRDYLDYLEKKDQINLDREAEFLFIASLLIYIKSQMLLPREQEALAEDDPRQQLVDRLLEFQKSR